MAARAATRNTRHFLVPLLLAIGAASVAAPALADDHHRGRSDHRWDRGDDRGWDRDDDRRHDRDDRRRYDRYQREQARRYEQQRRWEAQRQREYYRHAYQPRPVVVYQRPVVRPAYGYGYGRPPSWVVGRNYRSYGYDNVYYVPYNDYGRYRLYEPGYGRRWVRDDAGNFLLVAAATGIIASILTR